MTNIMTANWLCECTAKVDCPECGRKTTATFMALIGSGQIPKTDNLCSFCGEEYVVYAELDVSVRRMGEGF